MTSNTNIDNFGLFPVPTEGSRCLRIGNMRDGSKADVQYYTFTITNANKNFKFRYACVLEDPGNDHKVEEKPTFSWFMNTTNGGLNPRPHLPNLSNPKDVSLFYETADIITANLSDPFFSVSQRANPFTGIKPVYRGWTCVNYDLSNYIGEEVTIKFKVTDCSLGSHFGYAYVDGLCDGSGTTASFILNQQRVCVGAADGNLIMDGSASAYEDRYSIKISQITSWNWWTGTIGFGETRETGMILGQTVPSYIDLKRLWRNLGGGDYNCQSLYIVWLTTSDACGGESTTAQLFLTHPCPVADAGPNQEVCCSTPYTILGNLQIFNNPEPNSTYVWDAPSNVPLLDLGPVAITNPASSTFYNLRVTNEFGCRSSDLVKVTVKTPISLTLRHINSDFNTLEEGNCNNNQDRNTLVNCGNGYLEAFPMPLQCDGVKEASNGLKDQEYTYLWNTGATSRTIYPTPDRTFYSCQVSNGCETVTSSINVPGLLNDYYNVPLNRDLYTPEAFTPNGDGINDIIKIVDQGPHNVGPAYHAYRYRLRIYDRWGRLVACKEDVIDDPSIGFYNGEIFWDGKKDGSYVPTGVYKGQLTLWNCTTGGQGKDDFRLYRGESERRCSGFLWWYSCTDPQPIFSEAYLFNITVVR